MGSAKMWVCIMYGNTLFSKTQVPNATSPSPYALQEFGDFVPSVNALYPPPRAEHSPSQALKTVAETPGGMHASPSRREVTGESTRPVR